MSFSLPISGPIGRQQDLTNQRPGSRAITRMLTWVLTSHSNTRCNGMFDSFMIKQIRISDARHDYSVFLAQLFPAISETCSKIKHHWSKSDARRRNNEVGISVNRESRFGDQRNNWLHKCLWFNNKRSEQLCLHPRRRRLGTDADIRREPR